VKQVARELGVRYVLEGSVRKAGSRVRITGQLIDTADSAHIRADRFDGALMTSSNCRTRLRVVSSALSSRSFASPRLNEQLASREKASTLTISTYERSRNFGG
jgi:hypothetical protein